jgi:uncharacterized membrane protein YhaH (DUF805 family)
MRGCAVDKRGIFFYSGLDKSIGKKVYFILIASSALLVSYFLDMYAVPRNGSFFDSLTFVIFPGPLLTLLALFAGRPFILFLVFLLWLMYFYIAYRRANTIGLNSWTIAFNFFPVFGFLYLILIGYADSKDYIKAIPSNIYSWWNRYLDYEPPVGADSVESNSYRSGGFISSVSPYFSFKRSAGILEYWLSILVAFTFFSIAASAAPVILGLQIALFPLIVGRYYDLYGFFYYASLVIVAGPFFIAAVLIYVSAVFRRLRDVGWNLLFAIFIIVPLYNVALQIVLGVIPGRAKIREKIN